MSKNTQISELINFISVDGSGNVVFTTVSAAATNTDKFLVSDTGVLKFRTAAQLLSDIGAQASGSYQAALSGTGFVKISGSTISYDNSTYATETYVGTAISNLVASSPATLDTLNELALALGSDPNFATTVATSIGTKQAQLNGTGFVKISGTTISYDSSTYLTTASASSTYLTTTTAGTTYVPYTGATADVVLGNNNLKSKNTFLEGDGLYNGGGLRIKQYISQADGIDGYNTISSQTSGFAFSSSRGSGVFNNFILDPTSLPDNTQRSYILPNANGTLALTSNIPTNNNTLTNGAGYITSSALSTYLPLAGGIMSGNISYGVGNGVAWYLQPQAVGGGPSNGAVLRLKSHSGAGALSDRSGALAWIDGNNSRLDLFEWNSSLINAYVPINGTSAVFSSSVTATSLNISGSSNAIVTINSTYVNGGFLQMQKSGTNYGYVGCSASLLSGTTNDFAIISPSGTLELGGGNARGLIFSTTNVATFTSTVQSIGQIVYSPTLGYVSTSYQSYAGAQTWYVGAGSSGVSIHPFVIGRNLNGNSADFSIASTGAATFNSSLTVTTTGTFGFQDYRTQATQNVLVLRGEGVSGAYSPSLFNFYTKPGTTVNGIASIIIKSKYGSDAESGNIFELKGDGQFVAAGLITGQSSIHQSNAAGLIASNKWGTYNGGSTAMTFAYNTSGSVVWTNNSDRMFLTGDGYLGVGITPTYPLHITSTIANFTAGIINTSSGNNAGLLIKAGINSGNEILRCQTGTGANRFLVDVSGEITSTDGEIYFKRTAFDNYGHVYMGSNRHFYVRNSGPYNMYLQTNNVNQITLQNDGVTVISQLRTSTLYSEFSINLSGSYTSGTYYKICDSSQLTSGGIYMIVAYVDTYAAGGGLYFCTFASVPFYWFAGGSNSVSIQTLPTMLGTGHHNLTPPTVRIRLSTAASGDAGKQLLEFDPNGNWSNINGTSGATVTFYVKRIGS